MSADASHHGASLSPKTLSRIATSQLEQRTLWLSIHDILRTIHHIARSGRTVFIGIDLLVGPSFALQTVAQQDGLRQRIWKAMDLPLDRAWLSIALTTDAHWV